MKNAITDPRALKGQRTLIRKPGKIKVLRETQNYLAYRDWGTMSEVTIEAKDRKSFPRRKSFPLAVYLELTELSDQEFEGTCIFLGVGTFQKQKP